LDHPDILRIRELSRSEEDVQQDQLRAGNQLRNLLNRYYPQMLQLCPAVDQAWFWDLLEMAPLPARGAKLSKSRIKKLLGSYRIRRFDADEIHQTLSVPTLQLAPGAAEAAPLVFGTANIASRKPKPTPNNRNRNERGIHSLFWVGGDGANP
jgi:hypothetical protein